MAPFLHDVKNFGNDSQIMDDHHKFGMRREFGSCLKEKVRLKNEKKNHVLLSLFPCTSLLQILEEEQSAKEIFDNSVFCLNDLFGKLFTVKYDARWTNIFSR